VKKKIKIIFSAILSSGIYNNYLDFWNLNFGIDGLHEETLFLGKCYLHPTLLNLHPT